MKLEKYLVNYLETIIVMKNLMVMKWIQLKKVTVKRTLMTQNGEIIIDRQKNIECSHWQAWNTEKNAHQPYIHVLLCFVHAKS